MPPPAPRTRSHSLARTLQGPARLLLPLCVVGGLAHAETVTSNAPAVPIADGSPAVLRVTVDSARAVHDINVIVRADHPDIGELTLLLRHPDGTYVVLADGAGAGERNLRYTCFDDQADVAFTAGQGPFAGNFTPAEPLDVFNGKSAQGVWQLEVHDNVAGNAGTLWAFSLAFDGMTRVYEGPHLDLTCFVPTAAIIPVDVPFTVASVEATFEFDYVYFDLVRPWVRSPVLDSLPVMGYMSMFFPVYAKMISATFADAGDEPLLTTELPPFSGRWRTPTGTELQALSGHPAQGDWALMFTFDEVDCNGGQLFGGWLHFTATDACLFTEAENASYGVGVPGTLGTPTLGVNGLPQIGKSFLLGASNSSGAAVPAALLVGTAPTDLPFLGGQLLVLNPQLIVLQMPPGGLVLPVTLPANVDSCGLELFLQMWQPDAAAPGGASASAGLRLRFGS